MKIDYQELIKRLKEVNKKWFDKDLDDYKKDFYFPIETIPIYEQKDLRALDNYVKYYILQAPIYKLNFHKQLSYLDFYCLGGSHSRFEHVIGTTIIGSKILKTLEKKEKKKKLLKKWERLAFLTALLIHDCGEPPFSHSMELLKSLLIRELKITIEPDQKLDKVILSYYLNEQDNNLLRMLKNPWVKDVENERENKKNLVLFIKLVKSLFDFKVFKEEYSDKCFLYELLNSDFDCDRFDWIGRDSLHLGEITETSKYRDNIIKLFKNVKFYSISEEGKQYDNKLAYSIYDNYILSSLSKARTDLYNNYYHSIPCRIFDTVFPNLIYRFFIKYDLIIHRHERELNKEQKNNIIKEILKLPDFEFLNFIYYVEGINSGRKSWYISHALNDLFMGHFPSIKYRKNLYKDIIGLEKQIDEIEKEVTKIVKPRSDDQEQYEAYIEVIVNKYQERNKIPIEICLYYLCFFLSAKASQHIFPIQQNLWKKLLKSVAIKKKVEKYVKDIKKDFEGKIGDELREETEEEIISYPQIFISIPQYMPNFVEIKELNIGRKEKHKGFETYLYDPDNNNDPFPLKQNIPEQKADFYYSVFLLIPDYLVEFEQHIINEFEDFLRDLPWWRIKIEQE